MFAHIKTNDQTPGGRMLRRMLDKAEESDDEMSDVRQLMIDLRDGADNPANSANYAEVVKYFGVQEYVPAQGNPTVAQTDKAREMFLELDSAFSKTSGNGSVSNVRSARDQLFSKLRG